MNKKLINQLLYISFFILFLGFPFEHFRIRFFRGLSKVLYRKFQETTSFSIIIPDFIEKKFHLYASDFIALGITVLLFICKKLKMKDLIQDKRMRYLIAFLLVCNLSVLFSIYRTYYYLYFSIVNLALGFLFFFLITHFFKNRTQIFHLLFIGIIVIGGFESLIAIFQFFTQKNIGLHFLGEPYFNINRSIAFLPLPEKGRWLIELFCPQVQESKLLIRATGTFAHTNIFAGFLVFSLIVSYYGFLTLVGKKQKIVIGFCIFIQIFSLFLTFSRSGILAYLLATGVWFGLAMIKKISLQLENKNSLFILGWLIFLSGLFSVITLYPYLEARGGFVSYNSFVRHSDLGRLYSQNNIFESINDHIFLGVGYNCCTFSPHIYDRPHNIYLLIIGETGILGLILFLLFIFSLIRQFFSSIKNVYSHVFFAVFIGFLFIGLCDLYFLSSQVGKLMFFLVAGGLSATIQESQEEEVKTIKPMINFS